MLRALVIDDHPLFRAALVQVVSQMADNVSCAEAETLERAIQMISHHDGFDIILLDLGLPGASGLSGLLSVRDKAPTTPVVIVSATENSEVITQATRLGISGFLPKSAGRDEIRAALETVLAGGLHFGTTGSGGATAGGPELQAAESLTPRQLTVLRLLGEGKPNKQIAYELNISQETVKIHISAILRKLQVTSRAQAILFANRLNRW